MAELGLRVAVVICAAVLGAAAVSVLVWMAAIRWTDVTGTAVGGIFLILASIQLGLSIVWFRKVADKTPQQPTKVDPNVLSVEEDEKKEAEELEQWTRCA